MGNAVFVQPPMKRRRCLLKWPFKISQVIVFTMMVGDSAGLMVQCCVADIGHTAFDQGEHVLCCVFIEQPPRIANAHVDWRRMGKAAAFPDIVVWKRFVVWPAAACREPGMPVNLMGWLVGSGPTVPVTVQNPTGPSVCLVAVN